MIATGGQAAQSVSAKSRPATRGMPAVRKNPGTTVLMRCCDCAAQHRVFLSLAVDLVAQDGAAEKPVFREGGGADARQGADPLQKRLIEDPAAGLVVALIAGRHGRDGHVRGLEAEIDAAGGLEAPEKQTGTDQGDESQGHLRRDRHVEQASMAPAEERGSAYGGRLRPEVPDRRIRHVLESGEGTARVGRRAEDPDQPLRLGDRERVDEDDVEQDEDRGARTNAERQQEGGQREESRPPQQRPQGGPQIPQE